MIHKDSSSILDDARADRLQDEFDRNMPCASCSIKDVCKYRNTIRKVDYNPEVFSIRVQCKIKCNYNSKMQDNYNP